MGKATHLFFSRKGKQNPLAISHSQGIPPAGFFRWGSRAAAPAGSPPAAGLAIPSRTAPKPDQSKPKRATRAVHRAPCTPRHMHHTRCTLHPAPQTLYSAPCTTASHTAQPTLRPMPCTSHPTLRTRRCAPHSPPQAPHTGHPTPGIPRGAGREQRLRPACRCPRSRAGWCVYPGQTDKTRLTQGWGSAAMISGVAPALRGEQHSAAPPGTATGSAGRKRKLIKSINTEQGPHGAKCASPAPAPAWERGGGGFCHDCGGDPVLVRPRQDPRSVGHVLRGAVTGAPRSAPWPCCHG